MPIIYPTRFLKENAGDVLINVLLIRELSKLDRVYLDGAVSVYIESLLMSNNEFKQNIIFKNLYLGRYGGCPVIRWLGLLLVMRPGVRIFTVAGHLSGSCSCKGFLKDIKDFLRVYVFKLFGFHFYCLGVTIGPYSSFRWLIQKKIFERYSLIGVRDVDNLRQLQEDGLSNAVFCDDISYLYDSTFYKVVVNSGSFSFPNAILQDPYVVVSMRSSVVGSGGDVDYFDKIIKALNKMILDCNHLFAGTKVVVAYQVDCDKWPSVALYEMLSLHCDCYLIDSLLNLSAASVLYKNASFVVSNRLHVCLLSLLNGTVALALTDKAKHSKLSNLYRQLGADQILLDVGDEFFDLGSLGGVFAQIKGTLLVNNERLRRAIPLFLMERLNNFPSEERI